MSFICRLWQRYNTTENHLARPIHTIDCKPSADAKRPSDGLKVKNLSECCC